ncbi:MAG: 4Fe-4S dicluster domain-containing protein [Desulfofustis sp.]|jgi:heterodisulfide reductase subunit C2
MSSTTISPKQSNKKFLRKLEERGVDVQACYQCGRCSAGCPITEFFDLTTMEVVRLAAYGMEEQLLNSKAIWLCAACETCATRCPNDIDIAVLMDILRELVLRKGVQPAEPRVPLFHQCFLGSIAHWGRAYEVGLIAGYKMKSKDFMGDMKVGMKMFSQGKLSLKPHSIKGKSEIQKIFSGKGKEYER